MPPPPDPHGIAVRLLAVTALFLFSRDRIPMETSALVVLGVLIVGFELFPYESPTGQGISTATFLAGFGNSALITIMALLICTRALEVTGALQAGGRVSTTACGPLTAAEASRLLPPAHDRLDAGRLHRLVEGAHRRPTPLRLDVLDLVRHGAPPGPSGLRRA